jgi:hypothetical protein
LWWGWLKKAGIWSGAFLDAISVSFRFVSERAAGHELEEQLVPAAAAGEFRQRSTEGEQSKATTPFFL